jgi:hypothetical protein
MALTPAEKLKLANHLTTVLDDKLKDEEDAQHLGAEVLLLAFKSRVGFGILDSNSSGCLGGECEPSISYRY